MKEEKIIISLGGSLIVPGDVDVNFLNNFKNLIISFIKKGKKFVIITGGGKLARSYQAAGMAISNLVPDQLDWLGIYSTRFNAEFVRTIFGEYADSRIITDPTLPIKFENSIILGGGWKPGNSTDLVAVTIASSIGANKIINLSNTDYIYDSDPNTNKDAKKFEKISWKEYKMLVPENWHPGLNSPFDPIAAQFAEGEGITVITMNGKNISNLEACLNGEKFEGTTIS